jgi:hypothetical protein
MPLIPSKLAVMTIPDRIIYFSIGVSLGQPKWFFGQFSPAQICPLQNKPFYVIVYFINLFVI